MRGSLLVAALAFVALPAVADEVLKTAPTPALKPLDEVWEAAYVQNDRGVDVKIGHVHLHSALAGPGKIRTTKELRFVVGRAEALADLKADVSTVEDGAGKVSAINAKIWLGRDRVQAIDCEIKDTKILVTAGVGAAKPQEFRWDPANLGLAGEQTLLRDRKAKSGDEFTYKYYEVQVTHPITVKVAVKDLEDVALPGGVKRKLLKVTTTPDALTLSNGQKLQFPPATFWADPVSLDTIKTQMDIPEIGKVSLIRTSKIAALAPNGQVPDLMKRQSIFLAAKVEDMHERDAIVYKVTYTGDALPKELVVIDGRQAIKNIDGKTFELHMTARRKPETLAKEDKAAAEFLKSNHFLNSDDSEVKKLATKAVGSATEPWIKAQKIEAFVRNYMRPADYTEAMAPADHVARTRTGDCTEYAMLAAAMCRAQGIPSRTAIGLVYVNNLLGKPGLAFHMWLEVFVKGQWLGLDATIGHGSIGPGHIKITDHSWDGIISFTPLLPVKGFIMANPKVEVLTK